MKAEFEWPLLGLEAEGVGDAEHAAVNVLRFYDVVDQVRRSDAVEAVARRRAGQILHSGHTPESDLAVAPGKLAREALWRCQAFLEVVGPYRMNLPPQRRRDCLKYIEGAAASLVALWDRVQVEVDE